MKIGKRRGHALPTALPFSLLRHEQENADNFIFQRMWRLKVLFALANYTLGLPIRGWGGDW